MSSLSIYPRKLGWYFEDFYWYTRFYFRDEDYPKIVKRLFETKVIEPGPQQEEKIAYYAPIAYKFAKYIQDNKNIMYSMIEWLSLYSKEALIERGYQPEKKFQESHNVNINY